MPHANPENINALILAAYNAFRIKANLAPTRLYLGKLEEACLDLYIRATNPMFVVREEHILRTSVRRQFMGMEVFIVDAPAHLACGHEDQSTHP